jgi:hypothetical protein
MTLRAGAVGCVVALGVLLTTAGCTPQHAVDPNGRCLTWQMAVSAEVHPSSTVGKPAWDVTFTDTDTSPCVFGGVPSVRFLGSDAKTIAGIVSGQPSEEQAVPLGRGDTAYATIALDPTASASCTPIVVHWLRITAPHVAGGTFLVKAPARFVGCASAAAVASVGQVTAKRGK